MPGGSLRGYTRYGDCCGNILLPDITKSDLVDLKCIAGPLTAGAAASANLNQLLNRPRFMGMLNKCNSLYDTQKGKCIF